jgi:N-formylglutamate amidohydrolase
MPTPESPSPSPVVISVPHAGRFYPAALLRALRLPAAALATLEDRHVDAVAAAARTDEAMLVQQVGRAWIDLNRAEDERDSRVDDGALPPGPDASAKLRSGLGLVPRRASAGELWTRRFSDADVSARIEADHRPYHQALAGLLAASRSRWGVAVLVDVHSMPPLAPGGAQVVIGDLFGQAAAARFVTRAEAVAIAAGRRTALNVPYAGSHVLHRHGRPAAGVHAIQIELDRSLYLDPRLDRPGPGLASTAAMLRQILRALADEALDAAGEGAGENGTTPIAAE